MIVAMTVALLMERTSRRVAKKVILLSVSNNKDLESQTLRPPLPLSIDRSSSKTFVSGFVQTPITFADMAIWWCVDQSFKHPYMMPPRCSLVIGLEQVLRADSGIYTPAAQQPTVSHFSPFQYLWWDRSGQQCRSNGCSHVNSECTSTHFFALFACTTPWILITMLLVCHA